jgi:aspartyl protease family protein
LNRRTEFRIISKDFVPKTQNKAMTSQIENKTTTSQTQPEQTKNIEKPDETSKAPVGQTQNTVKPVEAQNTVKPVEAQKVVVADQAMNAVKPVETPKVETPIQTQNVATPSQSQKVVVQINPDDNVVPLTTNSDNTLSFSAVINGFTTQVTLSEEGPGLSFSSEQTLKMLKAGAIGKTDFDGDPEKILGNNSVADKSIFTVGEITITTKSAFDLEATVLQKQKAAVLMNEKVLKRFGTFSIDKEKKQLIFK